MEQTLWFVMYSFLDAVTIAFVGTGLEEAGAAYNSLKTEAEGGILEEVMLVASLDNEFRRMGLDGLWTEKDLRFAHKSANADWKYGEDGDDNNEEKACREKLAAEKGE